MFLYSIDFDHCYSLRVYSYHWRRHRQRNRIGRRQMAFTRKACNDAFCVASHARGYRRVCATLRDALR